MADTKVKAPRIYLEDFLNHLPDVKAGRVELVAAFAYHMEHVKGIMFATEDDFKKFFEDFKNLSV